MALIYLHLGMAHSPHGEGYWDEQWELLLVSLLKGRSLPLHSHKEGPALAGPSVDFFLDRPALSPKTASSSNVAVIAVAVAAVETSKEIQTSS